MWPRMSTQTLSPAGLCMQGGLMAVAATSLSSSRCAAICSVPHADLPNLLIVGVTVPVMRARGSRLARPPFGACLRPEVFCECVGHWVPNCHKILHQTITHTLAPSLRKLLCLISALPLAEIWPAMTSFQLRCGGCHSLQCCDLQ